MSTKYNRIKVADLEKNQPDKILTTNSTGELQFSNLNEIKIDNYNALDYIEEGKSLDARQGKILKDLVDNKIDKTFGSLQANKILGTDVNGNLKMYSLPNFQAPFIGDAVLTFLPDTTGNLTIKGAFFTPSMTVTIQGQTVNYITFINDNEIQVNLTTGIIEGDFDVILNNGVSATFSRRMLIVLGTVYKPDISNWTVFSGTPDLSTKGDIKLNLYNVPCAATCFTIPNNKNFRVYFTLTRSPLGAVVGSPDEPSISLISAVDNSVKFAAKVYLNGPDTNSHLYAYQESTGLFYGSSIGYLETFVMKTNPPTFYFERIGSQYRIRDYNTNIVFSDVFSGDLKIRADIRRFNITNIRYVELVS